MDLNQTKLNPLIHERVTEFRKKVILFTDFGIARYFRRI